MTWYKTWVAGGVISRSDTRDEDSTTSGWHAHRPVAFLPTCLPRADVASKTISSQVVCESRGHHVQQLLDVCHGPDEGPLPPFYHFILSMILDRGPAVLVTAANAT